MNKTHFFYKSGICSLLIIGAWFSGVSNAQMAEGFVIAHPHYDVGYAKDYLTCMQYSRDQIRTNMQLIEGGETRTVYNHGNILNVKDFTVKEPQYTSNVTNLLAQKKMDFPANWTGAFVNGHSGEYLVRTVLFSVRYLEDTLNYRTNWYQLNDTPSFTPQLPQVLAKSGVNFIIIHWGYGCPSQVDTYSKRIFRMVGLDGTGIIGYAGADRYSFNLNITPDAAESALGVCFTQAGGDYGVTSSAIVARANDIATWNTANSASQNRLWQMRPCSELADTVNSKITAGVYNPVAFSSYGIPWRGRIKKKERQKFWSNYTANRLPIIEKVSVLLDMKGIYSYPQTEINSIWERILWMEEHNGGLAVDSEGLTTDGRKDLDAKAGYDSTNQLLNGQMELLTSKIQRSRASTAVTVFNALNWTRTDAVIITVPKNGVTTPMVVDKDGTRVLTQTLSSSSTGFTLLFEAKNVPSMGYKTFYVEEESGAAPSSDLSAAAGQIENTYYRVNYAGNTITSVYDKTNSKEMMESGSFEFGAGISSSLLEDGSLRKKVRIIRSSGTVEISLCAYTDRVDLWATANQLNQSFPIHYNITTPELQAGIQYGSTPVSDDMSWRFHTDAGAKFSQRSAANTFVYESTDQDDMFHHLGKYWIPSKWWDVKKADNSYGITTAYADSHTEILIGSSAGIFTGDEADVYLIFSYKGIGGEDISSRPEFNFSFRGHTGNWSTTNAPRLGWEMSTPLVAGTAATSNPTLPEEESLLTVPDNNVIVSVLKKCERSSGYVLRYFETLDQDVSADITFDSFFPVVGAQRANLIEESSTTIAITAGNITVPTLSQGIETVLLSMSSDSTPPNAPANLTNPTKTQTTLSLVWAASTQAGDGDYASYYRVYRNSVQISTATGVSYVDSALTAGTTYSYGIYAVDDSNNVSVSSSAGSFCTSASTGTPPPVLDTTPPNAPANLGSSAQTETSITIYWTASAKASDNDYARYYKISRDSVQISTTSNTTFTDTGLIANTTYNYSIYAVDDSSNASTTAATGSFSTLSSGGDIIPPSLVSVTAISSGAINVEFSEPVDEVSAETIGNYSIDNSITITSAVLGADLKTVTFATSEHSAGITYTITINGIQDKAGTPNTIAANSHLSYMFGDTTPPSKVTQISTKDYIADVGDKIIVSWTKVADADVSGYKIYYAYTQFTSTMEATYFSGSPLTNATVSSCAVTGLDNTHDYYFAVVAVDLSGNIDPVLLSTGPIKATNNRVGTGNYEIVSGFNSKLKVIVPAGTNNGVYIDISVPGSDKTAKINSANTTALSDTKIVAATVNQLSDTCTEFKAKLSLLSEVTIVIPYTAMITGETEDGLKIYTLNETTNEWELVSGNQTIDKVNNTVSAITSHFSVFRILGTVLSADKLTNVRVYPNPFKPNDNKPQTGDWDTGIIFDGLTNNSTIKIYTMSGELVNTLEETDNDGKYQWDVKNKEKEKLSSGTYIYRITNSSGEKITGKIGIVR